MVIKVTKETEKGNKVEYKSSKFIITPQDIQEADAFDVELTKIINKIESFLLKKGALSRDKKKLDPQLVWYTVGKEINKFIKKHKIEKDEEQFFWYQFYNHSTLLHNKSLNKVFITRNDFKTALLITRFSLRTIKKVGPWTMWRDILLYKVLLNDERLLKYVVDYLIKNPQTVHGSRPFLKAINERFKKMETTLLSDKELLKKIKEAKI